MQRFIFFFLISILTACASSNDVSPATIASMATQKVTPTQTAIVSPTTVPPSPQPTVTAAVEEAEQATVEADGFPDLNGREIIIAVENGYLPFNYVLLENGEPSGWDYDAWHAICALLNCVPVFETAVYAQLLPLVINGQVDVAANGIVITPERAKFVTFSDSYLHVEQRLMARSSEHLFTTINEFMIDPSLTVGVRANDTPHDTASDFFDGDRIVTYDQQADLFDALANNDVYAIIINVVILDPLIRDYVGTNANWFKFASHTLSGDELGFAFPQGSDLRQPVNLALQEMRENGTLDDLAAKYFSANFTLSHTDIENEG